jgi:hypothetical protein
MSAKHMATESIAHITIQFCPRASIMQTLVLLPIFSMDSANQQLSQIETMSTITTATSLLPMGNINITDQSLPADGQEVNMMLNNFLPFNVLGLPLY